MNKRVIQWPILTILFCASKYCFAAISDDGQTIVGYGINPNGDTEAWKATLNPIPIPPAIWLLGSTLFGLFQFRKVR